MQPKYLTRDEDYRWKHGIDDFDTLLPELLALGQQ